MNMQKALQRYRETAQLIDYNPSMGMGDLHGGSLCYCSFDLPREPAIHHTTIAFLASIVAPTSFALLTNPKTPSGSIDHKIYRDY